MAADRVALVIGNGAYQVGQALPNPSRDAGDVAALLKTQGFEVILIKDASFTAMNGCLEEFKIAASSAKVGLFYYAGHGIENEGRNYLLPVDAVMESPAQLQAQAMSLDAVLSGMRAADTPAKLVILDCCRDKPLNPSWLATSTRSRGGLSPIEDKMVPPATIIMFACEPGQVALDGDGKNSPFTSALVEHFAKPGLSAFDAFLEVSKAVEKRTEKIQIPWIQFNGTGRTLGSMSLHGKAIQSSSSNHMVAGDDLDHGFINSLGMKFVPVPGTDVLFCEHETRYKDYEVFDRLSRGAPPISDTWNRGLKLSGNIDQDECPVIGVSWHDANAFCKWLSAKEGLVYRIPTDREWSLAVGLEEAVGGSPISKQLKLEGVYPWGRDWPPPVKIGNLGGQELKDNETLWAFAADDYADDFPFLSPVKSFSPNKLGIFDLEGNVQEWCADWYSTDLKWRVSRGGSWAGGTKVSLLSSSRSPKESHAESATRGFRCVVEKAGIGKHSE